MNNKQAKDFLVQQAAEQASLEAVPLSDLEKRMMYFTESDASSCEYPIELGIWPFVRFAEVTTTFWFSGIQPLLVIIRHATF